MTEGDILPARHVALVTGGGSGIGMATALAFGKAGAKVVVNHVASEQEAADDVTGTRLVLDGGMMLYPGFHCHG